MRCSVFKKIAILGSTGSIGRQALDVISQFPDRFEVTAIAGGSNIRMLIEQARIYHPRVVAIGEQTLYRELKSALSDLKVTVLAGMDALTEVATIPEVDMVLTAVVGSMGIKPTLSAIMAHKDIALANKETLVAAGSVIIPAAQMNQVRILPVDSEHSAIFQCLEGRTAAQVARLILTASGGPFRSYQPQDLENITLEQALNHPNWRMGGKITIDSATMFNKGLEIIEAHWLFDMPFDRISVVIHPDSIIHSMVELVDGSILAQLGLCDMRFPIQLALTYPERFTNQFPKLDFTSGVQLNFHPVNDQLFPAVRLAYEAGRMGGTMPAVLNAVNEEAVQAFMRGRIKFTRIASIVSEIMGYHQKDGFIQNPDLSGIFMADQWARQNARQFML